MDLRDVTDIYVGNDAVKEVRIGDMSVWSKSPQVSFELVSASVTQFFIGYNDGTEKSYTIDQSTGVLVGSFLEEEMKYYRLKVKLSYKLNMSTSGVLHLEGGEVGGDYEYNSSVNVSLSASVGGTTLFAEVPVSMACKLPFEWPAGAMDYEEFGAKVRVCFSVGKYKRWLNLMTGGIQSTEPNTYYI